MTMSDPIGFLVSTEPALAMSCTFLSTRPFSQPAAKLNGTNPVCRAV